MNDDRKPASSQEGAPDLHASNGEVVRRVHLDRAADGDAAVAGYEGIPLAKAALAGDQTALDAFHELMGLALPVTEHCEGHVVRLTVIHRHGEVRAVLEAANQGGHDATCVDAAELVAWILSPEGRGALARRGITIP